MVRSAPFTEADIAPFLVLAAEEGWLCDRWEFEFLLRCFPQGCFVCREDGNTLGYITSISYGRSGWIGNLMVHPDARRRGIGRGLMERAVSALLKSGVETVWLTASEQGAGLYRKLGFAQIDTVNRWSGRAALNRNVKSAPFEIESVRAVDRVGWGDWRDALLRVTCDRGRLYISSGGFLCCQEWKDGTQIGPWGCLIGTQAGQLLDQALATGDEKLFLDVPAGNLAAATLLSKRGFVVKGSNVLMYLGDAPLYHPGNIYALASMGSMG
ncbi:MAG: GNAT family N-acetyltransferase [Geobacteraceae bacterium GWC2_58_44]|nr:MAG: GNAT family N-acetyltransferase [Geobacteraceae bacterium GWC2_58_44]HBG05511.1 N-acetyltransferase [Geobacter sp.]